MIRTKIRNLIKGLIPEKEKFSIDHPPNKEYGNYSVFFPLKKAQSLKKKIEKKNPVFLEKVEIIKPGFLNFYIKKRFLQKEIREILKKGKEFGKINLGRGKKTNIEFISANPTGQLHVGNGRAAFFGDALANIFEMAGYNVKREYYFNDAKVNSQIQELGKTALGQGESYLTPYLKSLIKELKNYLKNFRGESDAGYFLSQNIRSDLQKFVKEELKIKFNKWASEQVLYQAGEVNQAFQYLSRKKLIYQKDKAWWARTLRFGSLKDEVLIRKNGRATYFLSDIAYHRNKIKRGFKKIIDILGADHQGHIPRMEAAMKMLGFKGEFNILISQIVRLKSGKKLSKRKGEIITLEDLINEIGLDVVRYFYLSRSLSSQMEFDLDLAKEQSEKNPVYYIQYANARINSILAKIPSYKISNFAADSKFWLLNHSSELNLVRELVKFPEIIEDTVKDYQLQRLCAYGKNLAAVFHQFYRDCKVIPEKSQVKLDKTKKAKEKDLINARISLILAVKIVLSNLFSLMGISLPKKM